MHLPDFIIAGASRSGTTTLHHVLKHHPHLFLPQRKELQFFNRDENYARGIAHYAEYFELATPDQLKGEVSPPYFHKGIRLGKGASHIFDESEDSAIRAKRHLPNAKVILTLRNPITRAHSQFWKNKWQGHETAEDFEHAIQEELEGRRNPQGSKLCWLYKNRYSLHVEHWIKQFGEDNVLVVIFEDWTQHPQDLLRQIEAFLEVPQADLPAELFTGRTNAGRTTSKAWLRPLMKLVEPIPLVKPLVRRFGTNPGIPPLQDATRKQLAALFAPDISLLEGLIGRKLDLIWG